MFSPGNMSPDEANRAMNFAIIISALSDVPMPGVTDIGDLLRKLDPNSPWGVEIAAKLAEIKNFQVLLRLNAGQAGVWTKAQCQECRCTNWFTGAPFYRAQTHFDWVNFGKKKWVQCDLSKTDRAQGERKKLASAAYVDSHVLFFELLDMNDVKDLKRQCAEQAEQSCEK